MINKNIVPIGLFLFCLNTIIQSQSNLNNKIILFDSKRFIFFTRDGRYYTNTDKVDSIAQKNSEKQIFGAPDLGSFKSSPLFWDMIDSFILQINLYTDGTQMTFAHLRQYNINKLIAYDGQKLLNYVSNETLRDNYVLPIESKEMRIHFREDTLKGPVYFDFCATKDSFLLFVYLHDTQEVEVWNFVPYRFMINKATYTNTSKTPTFAKDKWTLLRTIPITLNGPFRIVHSRNRNYMITQEGEIFQLRTNTAKKSGRLPENALGGALLIDKVKDEVFYIKAADGVGILRGARLGGADKIRILKE